MKTWKVFQPKIFEMNLKFRWATRKQLISTIMLNQQAETFLSVLFIDMITIILTFEKFEIKMVHTSGKGDLYCVETFELSRSFEIRKKLKPWSQTYSFTFWGKNWEAIKQQTVQTMFFSKNCVVNQVIFSLRRGTCLLQYLMYFCK